MGTIIILEANRDESTTDEQWDLLRNHFINEYGNNKGFDDDLEYINSGKIHCPYSKAYLFEQIPLELREKLKGSQITINLWYEERDPDESETL